MPEEPIQILTDHATALRPAPSLAAQTNVATEGLEKRSVVVVDVMFDVLLATLSALGISRERASRQVDERHLTSIRWAENIDNSSSLKNILESLDYLNWLMALLTHPRLRVKMFDARLNENW